MTTTATTATEVPKLVPGSVTDYELTVRISARDLAPFGDNQMQIRDKLSDTVAVIMSNGGINRPSVRILVAFGTHEPLFTLKAKGSKLVRGRTAEHPAQWESFEKDITQERRWYDVLSKVRETVNDVIRKGQGYDQTGEGN
ncbi:MAG: hypothetical protein JSS75_07395 [Bacteroidetes bacterium]|nr:hypothetical protein [Bacteroidota bacterium]